MPRPARASAAEVPISPVPMTRAVLTGRCPCGGPPRHRGRHGRRRSWRGRSRHARVSGRPAAWRPAMSSSCAQISGTSVMPSLRAATAGKSLCRSGVAVNQTLIRSSGTRLLRSRMAVISSDDLLLACAPLRPAPAGPPRGPLVPPRLCSLRVLLPVPRLTLSYASSRTRPHVPDQPNQPAPVPAHASHRDPERQQLLAVFDPVGPLARARPRRPGARRRRRRRGRRSSRSRRRCRRRGAGRSAARRGRAGSTAARSPAPPPRSSPRRWPGTGRPPGRGRAAPSSSRSRTPRHSSQPRAMNAAGEGSWPRRHRSPSQSSR